jgi:hypothetical protein
MCDKNIITSNGKRLFLAFFEFVSGEYEQSFHRFLYAKNTRDLKRQIKGYLKNYYGVGNTCQMDRDRDIYYYFYGEIAVKATGWLEVKDFKDVVDRMLW